MPRLSFPLDKVLALAAAARTAPQREPVWSQRCDPRYAKPRAGVPAGELGELTDDQLDGAKIPPGLWLVKDEGIYLMSNGVTADGTRVPLDPVYAKGYDPTKRDRMAVWDDARDAVGGDDFVEFLPAEWAYDAAARQRDPRDPFVLSVTPDEVRLVLPRPAPRRAS